MQARAVRTRRILLQAAAESFESHGYTATRLEDIVARKDVSKGALYFHFPSKEALAAAIIKEYRDLWPDAIARLRPHHPRAILLLLALSRELARTFRDNIMIRAGVRLVLERNLIDTEVQRPFTAWIAAVERLLSEAQVQGDLRPEVDLTNTAKFIVAAFAGFQQIFQPNAGNDPTQCVNTMWRCVLPSLINENCLAEIGRQV